MTGESIEIKNEYEQIGLKYYTPKEELLNTLTHAIGAVASLIIMIFMLIRSNSAFEYATSVITGILVAFEFTISALYHGVNKNLKFKMNLRKFDYPTTLLNIIGCSTGLCLLYEQKYGYIAFGISMVTYFILIALCFKKFELFRKVNVVVDFIIGFMMLGTYILIKVKLDAIPFESSMLYLAGVIFILLGAIIFRSKRIYSHTIFHILVMIGPILCELSTLYQIK